MKAKYPLFKLLTIDDLDLVRGYLENAPRTICELSLTNIMMWRKFFSYTIINDNLCLKISTLDGQNYFYEPLGDHRIEETLDLCLRNCDKIFCASKGFVSNIESEKYNIIKLRDEFDYVYSTLELSELKGRKFDGKRNHIGKFFKKHPDCEVVELKKKHMNDVLSLFDIWSHKANSRDVGISHFFQRFVLKDCFKYFHEYGLSGSAVFNKGECIAFITGSILNDDVVTVPLFYFHPDYPGVSQYLLTKACQEDFSSFKFINLEQDMGIAGLRKSKLSYYPVRLEEKFEIESK
ncbi:MAG: phosphatidylglycerol lysyltransferase domain-containing protein [Pseudomonadota bacterium]